MIGCGIPPESGHVALPPPASANGDLRSWLVPSRLVNFVGSIKACVSHVCSLGSLVSPGFTPSSPFHMPPPPTRDCLKTLHGLSDRHRPPSWYQHWLPGSIFPFFPPPQCVLAFPSPANTFLPALPANEKVEDINGCPRSQSQMVSLPLSLRCALSTQGVRV